MAAEIEGATRIVAIVGPTASGKTALSVQAATRFSGEIVSCDSVQVYRGLDIGSGKPSLAQRHAVPHHLVDILDIREEMNAAVFARRASSAIDDIVSRERLPIVTGGTGLYLTALLKGLFEQPPADFKLRFRLESLATRHGCARLHRVLRQKDPAYAARTETADRVRIVRALEVWFATGQAFSDAQERRKPVFTGECLIVGLTVSREELRDRVTARARRMLADGLIHETRVALAALPPAFPIPRSLRSIGYREVIERLAQGALPDHGDEELLRAMVTSTMQYAKRQMTYFTHQFTVEWFTDENSLLDRVACWTKRDATGRERLTRDGSRQVSK